MNYGPNDLRLLPQLRGLAKARVLAGHRKLAEVALVRALKIVESNSNLNLPDRARAMIDLGDLYTITANRKAPEVYLNAWETLQGTKKNQQLASSLFGSPVMLYPRNLPFLYLDRQPDGTTSDDELFVNLQYNVSSDGRAKEIKVIGSNVTNVHVVGVTRSIKRSLHRPSIIGGKIVATKAVAFRQLFGVLSDRMEVKN